MVGFWRRNHKTDLIRFVSIHAVYINFLKIQIKLLSKKRLSRLLDKNVYKKGKNLIKKHSNFINKSISTGSQEFGTKPFSRRRIIRIIIFTKEKY